MNPDDVEEPLTEMRPNEVPYRDEYSIPSVGTELPVFAVRNPESSRLLIVFTGMQNKVGLTLYEFYHEIPDPKPNVLFLSVGARKRAAPPYLSGVPGLGDDRDSTVARFNALIAEWRVTEIGTVGASIGTFGAVMFGVLLKARRILAFGPITSFMPNIDSRVDRFVEKRQLDFSSFPEEERELPLFFARRSQGTVVRIFYSENHEQDRTQAERFRQTPGATLVPVADSDLHDVMRIMASDGRLQSELAQVFAEGSRVAA